MQITDQQQSAIHAAASELIAAAVLDRPVRLPDPDLAGAAMQPVSGVFVNLKRGGMLRGCCGYFSGKSSVAEALYEAARGTTDDPRFPPISSTELPYLEVEVWLLHSAKRLAAGGQRAEEVEVGRHGLQLDRGDNRALLLPNVAVQQKLTARQFLQQACINAALPPSAWIDPETNLHTFEGVPITRPIDPDAVGDAKPETQKPSPREQLDPETMKKLAKGCADNIFALLRGATPNVYLAGCPDFNVSGASILVAEPDQDQSIEASRISMRPPVPLQATLLQLCQAAVAAIQARRSPVQAMQSLNLALAIHWDPAMHGNAVEPDLRDVDPATRAVMVVEGQNSSWVHDPDKSPAELVDHACEHAKVSDRSVARVFSFAVVSTDQPLTVVRVPQPQSGPPIRPAKMAGRLYPADESKLWPMVDELLAGEPCEPQSWGAVMVPHGQLEHSGRVAAETLRRVKFPRTVIVLGPKHTPLGMPWAVAPHETWSVPGRGVPSDPELARRLAESIDGLELDAAAHHLEHATEVELPLIARLAPDAQVVGIAVGGGTLERLGRFAAELADALADRKDDTLLVISSDMNHFAGDEETRRLDEIALQALARLDPAAAHRTITDERITMCGLAAAVVALETLRRWDRLTRCERVAYATTAEATGEDSRVIGYAGMLFG